MISLYFRKTSNGYAVFVTMFKSKKDNNVIVYEVSRTVSKLY